MGNTKDSGSSGQGKNQGQSGQQDPNIDPQTGRPWDSTDPDAQQRRAEQQRQQSGQSQTGQQ